MAQARQDTGSRVIELRNNSERLKLMFLAIPLELGTLLLLYKVLTIDREGVVPFIFLLIAVGLVVFATGMLVLCLTVRGSILFDPGAGTVQVASHWGLGRCANGRIYEWSDVEEVDVEKENLYKKSCGYQVSLVVKGEGEKVPVKLFFEEQKARKFRDTILSAMGTQARQRDWEWENGD